jgi:hypothetical protein
MSEWTDKAKLLNILHPNQEWNIFGARHSCAVCTFYSGSRCSLPGKNVPKEYQYKQWCVAWLDPKNRIK